MAAALAYGCVRPAHGPPAAGVAVVASAVCTVALTRATVDAVGALATAHGWAAVAVVAACALGTIRPALPTDERTR